MELRGRHPLVLLGGFAESLGRIKSAQLDKDKIECPREQAFIPELFMVLYLANGVSNH